MLMVKPAAVQGLEDMIAVLIRMVFVAVVTSAASLATFVVVMKGAAL